MHGYYHKLNLYGRETTVSHFPCESVLSELRWHISAATNNKWRTLDHSRNNPCPFTAFYGIVFWGASKISSRKIIAYRLSNKSCPTPYSMYDCCQDLYRSGKMYWITFLRPWSKIMAVALKETFACPQGEVRTTHPIKTWQLYSPNYGHYLIRVWRNPVGHYILANFL